MRLLSSGDVCEIAGIPSATFDEWCRKGIVKPKAGGKGLGNHRRFTLMQTVAIALAVELRKAERGCALSFAGQVIKAVGSMTEKELVNYFENDATRFMTVCKGQVVMDRSFYEHLVDLQVIYTRVKVKVTKIEYRLRYHRGGRTRGLAGTAID